MDYSVIRDFETAQKAGEYSLALDIVRMQIANNLQKVHNAIVTDSCVKSGSDVYDFAKYCEISDSAQKEKMIPFFEVQEKLIGMDSASYEFDEPADKVLPEYVQIEQELKSLMSNV